MAEYYTKPEADSLFAEKNHTHNLEDLGGTELDANRVAVPESVSASFDGAYTLDEALESIANQLDGAGAPDLSGYATTQAMNAALAGKSNTDHSHTPAAIGAAAADHSHNYAAPTHTHAQSEIAGLTDALAAKADASALTAKADLVNGKVPASQLPGFVDDVLEYAAVANFPATGEAGKIYVATGTNKSYRWGGSSYVEISASLALGETSATAYRGDRGKTAYDHSQNAEVHVTAAQKNSWNSKANGNHSHTPASIGAAAAGHGHSYNDLSDKPTIPTIPASLPANGGNADTVDGKHASDFAAAAHTHAAAAITAHLEAVIYDAPVSGIWTNIPLTNWVCTGNGFTIVDNQIRVGAGISKVLISAQICVGSANPAGNKYFAIRKNASQDKARTQIRLHEAYTPETMCIPSLLIDVAEGDLLTIDYSGTQGDAIYGELIFTYLTVQKIA